MSRESLLVLRPRTIRVEVDGYPVQHLRVLSVREEKELYALDVKDDDEAQAQLLVRGLSDPDGKRILSNEDVDVVKGLPIDLVARLFGEAVTHCLNRSKLPPDEAKKTQCRRPRPLV